MHLERVMEEVKEGMGRMGVRFSEEGSEWILPGILYVNDLVSGESEEDLRVMIEQFVGECKRRGKRCNQIRAR